LIKELEGSFEYGIPAVSLTTAAAASSGLTNNPSKRAEK
jgi:hypothetical protein